MNHFRLGILILILAVAVGFRITRHARQRPTTKQDRVKVARDSREAKLRKLCAERGLPYPPSELFLRAFKREQLVEVWAGVSNRPLELLESYPLTAFSGHLGPKRREGDLQIPEGAYFINRFNPQSSYHLSLGLDYPNASDRVFADSEKPGYDIFIHGGSASVGCLAIGNDAIEELFVLATDVRGRTKRQIPVHIFPARMDSPDWQNEETEKFSGNSELARFWENLRLIYVDFERSHRLPNVVVNAQGFYEVIPSGK